MKEIYSFILHKKKNVEVKSPQEDGSTIVRNEEQSVPYRIILKKPSRLETEEAELVYGVEWSKAIKSGILTKPMLAKIYADSGGYLSQDDAGEYVDLLNAYSLAQSEKKLLYLKDELSEEEKLKDENLTKEIGRLFVLINDFEQNKSKIFDETAEVRARNKTIQWLALNLTYIQEETENPDEPASQFFVGSNYEKKIDYFYDLMESKDEFSKKVMEKSSFFWSWWYMSRAASREDFEELEKELGE